MPMRKSHPGDFRTSVIFPGRLYRELKAACAREGISVREKLIDLVKREFPEPPEPASSARKPSRVRQAEAGTEQARAV